MMMTSLETLKTSFALDIKLFEQSVSRDIGTEGSSPARVPQYAPASTRLWLQPGILDNDDRDK